MQVQDDEKDKDEEEDSATNSLWTCPTANWTASVNVLVTADLPRTKSPEYGSFGHGDVWVHEHAHGIHP